VHLSVGTPHRDPDPAALDGDDDTGRRDVEEVAFVVDRVLVVVNGRDVLAVGVVVVRDDRFDGSARVLPHRAVVHAYRLHA
jgi:hypothetical protein